MAHIQLNPDEIEAVVEQTYQRTMQRLIGQALAPIKIPEVGQIWPGQGGIYAGPVRPDDGSPVYHLIVSTNPLGRTSNITYGGYDIETPGASSRWDGQSNTKALVDAEEDHPAAQWASGLTIDGLSDYYLPAQRELMLCWINTPEVFDKVWHLSSTQYSPGYMWGQFFGYGTTNCYGKDDEASAVAVRRLFL